MENTTIKNIADLYEHIFAESSDMSEEDTIARIDRAIYKVTECGAHLSLTDDKKGVFIGSIVEGSDVEINADPLTFPFDSEEFWNTVRWVNDEACAEWHIANEEMEWLDS